MFQVPIRSERERERERQENIRSERDGTLKHEKEERAVKRERTRKPAGCRVRSWRRDAREEDGSDVENDHEREAKGPTRGCDGEREEERRRMGTGRRTGTG